MSKRRNILPDILKTGFFLSLGVLLIWLVVRNLTEKDKSEIMQSFADAGTIPILFVVLIGLLSHVSRAIRWQIMIEPLGHKPRFINTFLAVLVGYLANLAVPRLGEVSRCGILNKYEKLPVDSVLGTVVVERIVDVLLLLIVSVITLLWQFDVLYDKLYEAYQTYTNTGSSSDLFSLKTLLLMSIFTLMIAVILFRKKIAASKLYKKINGVLKGFMVGIKTITRLKRPYLFIFHSVFIWVLYFAGILAGFSALPQTAMLGPGAAAAILFFGTFAFILVQGGIGAYQIIVQNTLLLYGISSNVGYALGWIIWSSQTFTIIIGGLIALVILPHLNKKYGLSSNH
jgi:uncharacterized protein (TIRG00374 family)